MKRPDSSTPPTYDEALRIARDLAQRPDSLVPYRHQGLENARHGAGFAFLETIGTDRGDMDGYVLVTAYGRGSGVFWEGKPTIEAVIADHLARAEHDNRDIPDSELSVAHRMALEAYDLGLTHIDDASGHAKVDAKTADYAEFVLLVLRNHGNSGEGGRKVLARNDFLLKSPVPGRRYTQPCPHCTSPTIYQERYPRAVCEDCLNRTTDHAGRRVTGFNTHLSGGMIAYYTDTLEHSDGSRHEECVEVTQTGVCFIDGHPATMAEARFGGIVVQLAPTDKPRQRWFRRWFQ
ncbi:hypothetical protein DFR70_108142 [Nocardia tenerifensis]|uniref:Uncharacterized protein n=1 Tax=Nocardia tenerifensis TaxID=228006 RepID=A0A318K271_9NOCA|nr:hypothetical protein [Nocardia tenerifensis]PXX61584.1 hypothetical protein DFR70_108142 [Nocardia tenerifensis]